MVRTIPEPPDKLFLFCHIQRPYLYYVNYTRNKRELQLTSYSSIKQINI
jgi:hypothetical protein